ncbi:MAG: DegT/DnrJ/EryC1/StrS family aminotransferase, partial [Planctomycetes bacterium]|nr:DegT/DnrJ/EryC1/StrS family aminotransferase [Planctomycetota bacterium]
DGVVAPPTRAGAEHVFHVYCVRADDRAALQSFLKERGVASGIHYPTPLPFLQAYERLGHLREDFPVAAEYQGKILSLPMFPEMTAEQVRYVCESIQTFYAGKVLS